MRKTVMILTALALGFAALAGPAAAQENAADAYRVLLDDLRTLSKNSPGQAFVDEAEKRLTAFIEQWPDAPERAGALLNLGHLYSRMGRSGEAVTALEAYFSIDARRDPSEEIMARYVLASSYIAVEEYEKAEPALRMIVREGTVANPKIAQAAAAELGRIDTLKKLKIGMPAIDFTATAYNGGNVSLAGLRGSVVLLDFWASWCAPCRAEMPNVKKIYEDFHDGGFEILGISLDQTEGKFKSYVDEQQLPWPMVFDGKGWQAEIGRTYAVSAIPATFLIDRAGTIRYKSVRGEELRSAVAKLLAE
ncbi:MAG: redoxin domain-containing protein [Candidatus Krumholzibacteriota bacterium]|nr:redoxin domain-containing protein [Candidatus Krumholzibacteriota bacterium]